MRFTAPTLLPCFDAFKDGNPFALAIDPDAAGTPLFTDAQVDFSAIHTQHRMIPLGDGFCFSYDIVADQGATEAVLTAIGIAAMLPIAR